MRLIHTISKLVSSKFVLASEEAVKIERELTALRLEVEDQLNPPDPNDIKNSIVEIRAGAGGDEAALFANQLFRMYSRYAEMKRWQTNLISASHTGIGGLK